MERRLREVTKPLTHDEAFDWLQNVQELVERHLLVVGDQVKLPDLPGFVGTVAIAGRTMIVATGQNGWLTLLAADGEGIGPPVPPLTMTGFDPGVDEVVTVFGHPRVLGARADLFVAVRRWDPQGRVPELRLYRANAWWDEGCPRLTPGIEDAVTDPDASWPCLDVDAGKIPAWVAAGPLSMVPGLSPVKKPPPEDTADRWAAVDPAPARAVAWDGERLVWLSSGPKLVIEQGEPYRTRTLPLDRSGTALAIGAGTVPVALVCGAEWGVQGIPLDDGEPDEIRSWRDGLSCHSVAVALLPKESGWPDVVIAARDGRLHRFRYVDRERTFECRNRLVERVRSDLKLDRIEDWVEWSEEQLSKKGDRETRARMGRLLVRLVDLPAISRPTGAEVHGLARFLGGELTSGAGARVGKALGEVLLSPTGSGEEIRCPWPDPEKGPDSDLVRYALASWAYDEGRFALREEIDIALGNRAGQSAGPALDHLSRYRPQNHWDEWATLAGEERASFRRLTLLVDFALERYLAERQDRAKGQWDRLTACVSTGDLLAVGAGQNGLRIVRFQPSAAGIDQPSEIWEKSFDSPSLAPACIVQVSDSPPLFILGEYAARARFFDLESEWKVVHGQSGSSCAAVAAVPGPTTPVAPKATSATTAVWCLLGWNEGRRCFLELWEARSEEGGWAGGRVAYGPLGLRNVGGLGVLSPAREGVVELAAGDALTGELVRIRAHRRADGEDLHTTEVWRVPLDGGVTAVCVDRERGQVLAGSVAGTTWAIDVERGTVRWTFRSRHAVRSIHAEAGPGEGGYVILAPPDDLVVVSDERVRVWRRRHGGPFTDLAVASLSGGSRLLVGTGDRLHVFRMPAPDGDWSTRTVEERRKLGAREPERFRHAEAIEVAAALEGGEASDLLERFSRTRSRRARMEIVKRLATPEVGPDERTDILERLSWREISTLLHALPSDAGEWQSDIVEKLASASSWGTADRSRSAWSVAVVEVARRLAARAEKVAEVGEVLHRVPTDPPPDSTWMALEAGQAWLAAMARETGTTVAEITIDTVLEHLHQIPPALATELPLLVRTPGRAKALSRFGRWVLSGEDGKTDKAELRGVADDLEKEGDTPLVNALVGALRLAAAGPTLPWEEVCRLLVLVREVRVPELWAELIRPALLPADLGPPPGEGTPLAQQVDWLDRAVRRPAGAFDSDSPASWRAAALRVARLLDERLRSAYRQQLDKVEDIGRMRPEVVRPSRPTPQRLDVTLRLVPEGRRPIGEARIIVRCPDLVSFDEGKNVEWRLYRRELRDGEAPERLELRARCDTAAKTFQIEVKVVGAGSYQYGYTWDFPVPSAGDTEEDGGLAPFPKAVPTAYAAALEAAMQLDAGVAVVSADAAVCPSQLVQDLGRDAQSRIVNLDGLLSELGPGRRYPDLLRRPALLRTLSDLDPHLPVGEAPLTAVRASGARRLVFWPCEETLARVLDGHLEEPRAVLREVHRDSLRRMGAPALVFVLPSRLAARLRRWLGRKVTWLAPATLDARWLGKSGFDKAETETVTWLQKVPELDNDTAEEVFWRSGADLRVMHDWVRRSLQQKRVRIGALDNILREWGRKDLAALDPFELAALLVVSGAVTAESFKQLEAGMVLAQDIRTTVRPESGSQPKTIGHVGMVLTERLVRRLMKIQPRPPNVRVGGIRDTGGATDLTGEVTALHELLGGRLVELAKPLVDLGLAEKRGQLTQATSFCQCVVQSAVRSQGDLQAAYRDLAEEGHLLDGVSLQRLADISDAAAQVFGINVSLARLAGQLWSKADDPPGRGRAVNLTRELTGQVAEHASLDSPQRLMACPLPADRCTLVGVDPSETVGGYRFLFAWWSRPADPDSDWNQIDRWLDTLAELRDLRGDEVRGDRPLLLMLGPGAETLPTAPRERGIVVLRERDLRPVLTAETIQTAFWAAVRSHTGLARIAPFVSVGALPPGSSIFVGRRAEREDVRAHIHSRSFLVLGPRQIGKTSLLNAIYDDLSKSGPGPGGIQPRPILLSLQGVTASAAIADRLVEICKQAGSHPPPGTAPIELLQRVGATYRARGKRAVFIINEVDGLLQTEPRFFEGLRELHESGDMRFVLGGYVTAREGLGEIKGPLFHFTSGASGNRYFDLSVLTDAEAFELVDKLESEPLGLRWEQASEREEGRRLLVQRSYCVPWVIPDLLTYPC